jgi:biopolymer transport protein TolR
MLPTRRRNRLIADMNVVPYIDVMLVLLIIFMITSPLLSQGVDVIIITVNSMGDIFLHGEEEPITVETLLIRVAALIRVSPESQVLVKGDSKLSYGTVVDVMARLQEAGVPKVGLMTRQRIP